MLPFKAEQGSSYFGLVCRPAVKDHQKHSPCLAVSEPVSVVKGSLSASLTMIARTALFHKVGHLQLGSFPRVKVS